jgi:methyltransferase
MRLNPAVRRPPPHTLLFAALALERMLELLVSRRNEQRSGPTLGTAGRRSYGLIVALHIALFCLPLLERRRRRRSLQPAFVASALGVLVLATALRLWVIRTLGRGWNVRGRVPSGLEIVDSGPFRFVRHPNYAAVALEMAALPLAGGAPLSAALLSVGNAVVLVPRVRGEEALLARVPGYAERMGGKPRFLPRLSRRERRPERCGG